MADNNGWQPIETAPKDESKIACWREGWEDGPYFLRWKTNSRIIHAHEKGQWAELRESYFGDTEEWDDYELAQNGNGPTCWHPLSPLPIGDKTDEAT